MPRSSRTSGRQTMGRSGLGGRGAHGLLLGDPCRAQATPAVGRGFIPRRQTHRAEALRRAPAPPRAERPPLAGLPRLALRGEQPLLALRTPAIPSRVARATHDPVA